MDKCQMEDTTDDDQFLFDFRNESVVFLEPVCASDDECKGERPVLF